MATNSVCCFFSLYASTMLGCGATCTRICKNMNRMAATINSTLDLVILPSHVAVTLTDKTTGNTCHHTREIAHIPVSFELNTRLSRLSWKVAEGRFDIPKAMKAFNRILSTHSFNPTMMAVLVALANTSFCRLFGGDLVAMGIVALATLAGFTLKVFLMKRRCDIRLVMILSAWVAALIASAGYKLGITATPDVALATSVLFLIPGIPYINGVADMLSGHYLCSFARFMNAFLLTACIALGLTAAFLLMHIQIFK